MAHPSENILEKRRDYLTNEVEFFKNRKADYVKKKTLERMTSELSELEEELKRKIRRHNR